MIRKNPITTRLALLCLLTIPSIGLTDGVLFVENEAVRVENLTTTANTLLFSLVAPVGVPIYRFSSKFGNWDFTGGNFFSINKGGGAVEFKVNSAGDIIITGNVITSNCPTGCGPDYVFASDYELMSLSDLGAFIAENSHLPNIPPAESMETEGINMTQLQLRMLEKVEELTLYTLQQDKDIDELRATIAELRAQ